VLRLFRRHRVKCPQKSERYRRCACPIYVEGTLRGEHIRKALDLTSWTAATSLIAKWNDAGEIGSVKAESPAIAEAVEKFLADAKARHLGWETIRKYENLLQRRLLPWCDDKGYRLLKQVGVEQLREFRASWPDGPNYATKNLERLRAFFRFCDQAEWIKKNPALAVKAPKVKLAPTLPFSVEEMTRILDACDRYPGNAERIKAFVLVMRYAGLRIGDTIRLSRDKVGQGRIQLYTSKTGQPVYVPIPSAVQLALATIEDGERYFWTGQNIRSAVANWSRYLARVFELADIEGGHSHRFRDTAAVNWLLGSLSVEEVATLLGNSPNIVVKHYSPWVRERQRVLEMKVQASWTAEGAA